MATTIPNIIRALGYTCPNGFTKYDLIGAFMDAGYGSEKAVRRYKQCLKSNQIVVSPEQPESGGPVFISRYSPLHRELYGTYIDSKPIRAVKIERDGSATYLV